MDKISKRKCENNTCKTYTQSNGKRQKVYCRQPDHTDHTYSKKINRIVFVDDDCLSEIFMYIPVCERPKIAQVCKNWKRVVHSYCFKVKKLVLPHWEFDSPQNALEKFKTNEEKLSFLRSLLDKFCFYLTELDLVAYDNSNIVPFIRKSCPNLVKLRLRFKYPFDEKEFRNAFLRMSKLKVLTLIIQGTRGVPWILVRSLKNVASTLNELTIIVQQVELSIPIEFEWSFAKILTQLKALKKLELGGPRITWDVRDAIYNGKLDFHFHEASYEESMRLLNPNLDKILYLDLGADEKFTDDMLYNIANSFEFIECLVGNCALVTDVGIQAITKMKHLKRLYLYGKSHFTDSSLKLLKGLEILQLPKSCKITTLTKLKCNINMKNCCYCNR